MRELNKRFTKKELGSYARVYIGNSLYLVPYKEVEEIRKGLSKVISTAYGVLYNPGDNKTTCGVRIRSPDILEKICESLS